MQDLDFKTVFTTGFLGMLGGLGFLWRAIGQAKSDAQATALDVRREVLAQAESDRQERNSRRLENEKKFDEVWLELRSMQANNRDVDQRIFDRLEGLTVKLAQMPTRDEIKADRADMEHRITVAIRGGTSGP